MPADVAIIVPVMQRPQNAAPFMRSLHLSVAGLARSVYVMPVCDLGDRPTIDAWRTAGTTPVTKDFRRAGTFAKKVNFGYQMIANPWLFIVGDDVRFHPGWLDTALQNAEHTSAKVVGTNDLANPRVMGGEHGTHLLISRQYVAEQGASWDGPGVVCHEGYHHWFVDDEIVTVAKQRGVWAAARSAVVEHMHPYFGKGQMDAVYALGASHAEQDQALFARRLAEHSAVPGAR